MPVAIELQPQQICDAAAPSNMKQSMQLNLQHATELATEQYAACNTPGNIARRSALWTRHVTQPVWVIYKRTPPLALSSHLRREQNEALDEQAGLRISVDALANDAVADNYSDAAVQHANESKEDRCDAGGVGQSRCRCGRGEPSPGADVREAGPNSPGADVGGVG